MAKKNRELWGAQKTGFDPFFWLLHVTYVDGQRFTLSYFSVLQCCMALSPQTFYTAQKPH